MRGCEGAGVRRCAGLPRRSRRRRRSASPIVTAGATVGEGGCNHEQECCVQPFPGPGPVPASERVHELDAREDGDSGEEQTSEAEALTPRSRSPGRCGRGASPGPAVPLVVCPVNEIGKARAPVSVSKHLCSRRGEGAGGSKGPKGARVPGAQVHGAQVHGAWVRGCAGATECSNDSNDSTRRTTRTTQHSERLERSERPERSLAMKQAVLDRFGSGEE